MAITPADFGHEEVQILVNAWITLRDSAGYGNFAGAGIEQQATNILSSFDLYEREYDDMGFDNFVYVVVGFLLTSLNSDIDEVRSLAENVAGDIFHFAQ